MVSKLTVNLVFAPAFRLRGRRQREFQIADLQGIFVIAQGIKAFKKGMQDDDKTAEKPEPVKTIDHTATTPPTAARSDVGSKVV